MIRVILSCNRKPEYFYCIPITALFWQDIIGYPAVIGLEGTERQWQENAIRSLVLKTTKQWCPGTKFLFLENNTKLPSYSYVQLMRLFLPLKFMGDFNITADIDMLPLNREYFKIVDKQKLHYFDPCVLGRPPYQIAISYVGACGKLWKRLFGVSYNDITPDYLESIVKKYEARSKAKGMKFWYTDQLYLTDILFASDAYKNNLYKPPERKLRSNNPVSLDDRIDSLRWDLDPQKAAFYIDAHLPLEEPWNSHKNLWGIFDKILKIYIPEKRKIICDYSEKFFQLIR